MEGTDFQKFLELELQVRELKQQLIKKDGFIEALQSSIQQSQKQHFYEMQTMKESFKNESSRMHNLWANFNNLKEILFVYSYFGTHSVGHIREKANNYKQTAIEWKELISKSF
eukprot:TRINITY_DN974_c0_g1_i1.p1 TRINITY_DN974_c0_g1~~TRINITY_DN974_c0_g1_i1.p1  ORF type:complete len:113 (-),score=11.72 TRINITY_DN974_c0_g1_i1:226-564(-)